MSSGSPVVFLLDDEPGVVVKLGRILRANGFAIRAWTSPAEFLKTHDADTPGCLVTDLRMPGMSGLEVQRVLLARGTDRPLVFITDESDVRTAVLGMKAGAVNFLTKPVQPAELIGAVREAIARDTARRAHRCEQADIKARLGRLTPRERQVLHLLATGMLNKQIAAELGAAVKTIKSHRKSILEKMEVRSATVLVGLLCRGKSYVNDVLQSVEPRASAPRYCEVAIGQGRAA
jgi:FixJ family two-component response regulator